MEGYFKMRTDFNTTWFLSFDRVTNFGIDAGGRFWIRCDGQEYGTHLAHQEQFEKFIAEYESSRNPRSSVMGVTKE